jgi:8-oxo-dGTP pyrophosphatase MutT (NUDIX family)
VTTSTDSTVLEPVRQNSPMTTSAGASDRARIAAAFLRDGDRVLLCHRSAGRRWYPDVWDLPGGHVDEGERPEAALVRELDEELGITVAEPSGPPMHEIATAAADMQLTIIARPATRTERGRCFGSGGLDPARRSSSSRQLKQTGLLISDPADPDSAITIAPELHGARRVSLIERWGIGIARNGAPSRCKRNVASEHVRHEMSAWYLSQPDRIPVQGHVYLAP